MGDLGAGKTAFAQGFAAALGVEGPVTSPTFALVRQYRCAESAPVATLIHADVYRTGGLGEVVELALAELVEERAVALVEWGELAAPALGDDALEVSLELREATVEPDASPHHAHRSRPLVRARPKRWRRALSRAPDRRPHREHRGHRDRHRDDRRGRVHRERRHGRLLLEWQAPPRRDLDPGVGGRAGAARAGGERSGRRGCRRRSGSVHRAPRRGGRGQGTGPGIGHRHRGALQPRHPHACRHRGGAPRLLVGGGRRPAR